MKTTQTFEIKRKKWIKGKLKFLKARETILAF